MSTAAGATPTTGNYITNSMMSKLGGVSGLLDLGYGMLIFCLVLGFIIGLTAINSRCTANLTSCIPKLVMIVIVLIIIMTIVSFLQLPHDPNMRYEKQWQVWVLVVSFVTLIILGFIMYLNSGRSTFSSIAGSSYY